MISTKKLDRTFAEFLVPQFISEYCDSCHTPIEEESVILIEHLPSSYLLTKVDRRYCLECALEAIQLRKKVRRAELNSYSRIRNVSFMTEELRDAEAKRLSQELWEQEYDKNPGRVKHI